MADGTETAVADKSSQQSKGTSTYTEEWVKEQVRKARSDALADKGRLETALANAQKIVERMRQKEEADLAAELEAHRDDPEYIKSARAIQRATKAETELANKEAELAEKEARLQTYETERSEITKNQTAREIAERLGIDADKLIKLSKRTDGSAEAIEEIAQELPKSNSRGTGKPDSNSSRGGGSGVLTKEEVGKMSPEERNKRRKEIAKLSF